MGEIDKLIELVIENDITFEEALALIEACDDEKELFEAAQELVASGEMREKVS